MQFKLDGSLEHAFQEDITFSTVTGRLITYPGFTPKIGDVFLYNVTDGKVGLFKVSKNPQRLTIHNTTSYVVDFVLYKVYTDTDRIALEERTREVAYFDKQRFLTEDGALLTSKEVEDIRHLESSITKMLKYYGDTFYSESMRTLMYGEIYDPYLTHFYRETVGCYCGDLYIDLPVTTDTLNHWSTSVYASLMYQNPLGTVLNTCTRDTVTFNAYSNAINNLIGKRMVRLDPNGEETYIDTSLVLIDPNCTETFDKALTLMVEQSTLSTAYLQEILNEWKTYSVAEQFYRIPIIIYMCNLVLKAIHDGGKTNIVNKVIEPYIHIPFTSANMEAGLLTLTTSMKNAVAIVTDVNELINISDTLLTETSTGLVVDLTAILMAYELNSITNTWYLVVRNILT